MCGGGDDLKKIITISYRESCGHLAVLVDLTSTWYYSYWLVGINVDKAVVFGQCEIWMSFYFFFFQAEDGIRDLTVTGVQTCCSSDLRSRSRRLARRERDRGVVQAQDAVAAAI